MRLARTAAQPLMASTDDERVFVEGMGKAPTYYCWHCYAANSQPTGACVECGHNVEQPAEATWTDQLIWALGHPIPETRMIAAQVLGQRREAAAERPLRALVRDSDPFLAAQALHSLVAIVGVAALRDELLEPLARTGAPAVRQVALLALDGRE
jgi:hypothetical protein